MTPKSTHGVTFDVHSNLLAWSGRGVDGDSPSSHHTKAAPAAAAAAASRCNSHEYIYTPLACGCPYPKHSQEVFPTIYTVRVHADAAAAMRNVALEHARTRYVLLADIDFYPSESISTLAEQWSEK